MDYLGLTIAIATGGFLAVLLAAIDALLLKRHVDWLNTWAVRWFVFFDEMKIPHMPIIVALFFSKYAWLLLYLGLILLMPCIILAIYHFIANTTMLYGDEVFLAIAVGAAAIVYYLIIKLLGYAAAKGRLLLMLTGTITSLVVVIYFMDPNNQEFNSEPDLLAAVFGYIALIVFFFPLGFYLAALLALFAILTSFRVFKVTTCHLFELSVEKKTIFAHLGILLGMLIAGGKFGLELVRLL